MRFVFLDSKPLGLVSSPRGNLVGLGDRVTVATENVRHFSHFVDARAVGVNRPMTIDENSLLLGLIYGLPERPYEAHG